MSRQCGWSLRIVNESTTSGASSSAISPRVSRKVAARSPLMADAELAIASSDEKYHDSRRG